MTFQCFSKSGEHCWSETALSPESRVTETAILAMWHMGHTMAALFVWTVRSLPNFFLEFSAGGEYKVLVTNLSHAFAVFLVIHLSRSGSY